jgi:hypothetical protein
VVTNVELDHHANYRCLDEVRDVSALRRPLPPAGFCARRDPTTAFARGLRRRRDLRRRCGTSPPTSSALTTAAARSSRERGERLGASSACRASTTPQRGAALAALRTSA